jgi:hypothetical protein
MLLSSLSLHVPVLARNVYSIFMLDKNTKMNLSHIHHIKDGAQKAVAPIPITARIEDLQQDGIDNLLDSVVAEQRVPLLMGIHLCKKLSSRFVDLFNRFPQTFALLLAPCCLPNPSPKLLRCGECGVFSADLFTSGSPYDSWVAFLVASIACCNKLVVTIRERDDLVNGEHQWQKHSGNKCLFASRDSNCLLDSLLPPELLSEYTPHIKAGEGVGVSTQGSNTRKEMEFSAVAVHFDAAESDQQDEQRVEREKKQQKLSKVERRKLKREKKQREERQGCKSDRLVRVLSMQLARLGQVNAELKVLIAA